MSETELLTFVDKHDLELMLAETINDTALKFLKIQNKFNEYRIPEEVLAILDRLMKFSLNSYLVGGCTRDIILGERVNDWDFVTDIPYEQLKEIFSAYSFKETGTEFLVFNLKFVIGEYEIANFRKDSKGSDGRKPNSVEFGTIEEDQKRRDFTTGNIYWNTDELIIDEQSVDDIIERKLRFVGNPEERIQEDFLRGWRAYRLAKSKNLEIEKNTLTALRRNWHSIYNASNPTRVLLELEKLCLK